MVINFLFVKKVRFGCSVQKPAGPVFIDIKEVFIHLLKNENREDNLLIKIQNPDINRIRIYPAEVGHKGCIYIKVNDKCSQMVNLSLSRSDGPMPLDITSTVKRKHWIVIVPKTHFSPLCVETFQNIYKEKCMILSSEAHSEMRNKLRNEPAVHLVVDDPVVNLEEDEAAGYLSEDEHLPEDQTPQVTVQGQQAMPLTGGLKADSVATEDSDVTQVCQSDA